MIMLTIEKFALTRCIWVALSYNILVLRFAIDALKIENLYLLDVLWSLATMIHCVCFEMKSRQMKY